MEEKTIKGFFLETSAIAVIGLQAFTSICLGIDVSRLVTAVAMKWPGIYARTPFGDAAILFVNHFAWKI